jgi:hypothetical protein
MKEIGLYYPHTQIRDPRVLKAAMLLWDRLEIIVPYKEFELKSDSTEVTRAIKETKFLKARESTDLQEVIHERVVDLFSGDSSDWFLFTPDQPEEQQYLIYPEKFDYLTWVELKNRGIAKETTDGSVTDMVLHRSVGLTLMAILAEACAGTTRELFTDVPDAQRAKAHVMAKKAGGAPVSRLGGSETHLADITLRGVNGDTIPMERLIEAHNDRSNEMSEARGVYRDAVGAAFESIKPESTPADIEWIKERFEGKMETYRERLGSALRMNAGQLLAGPILGGFFAFAGLVPATLGTITGAFGAWLKFRVNRQKALAESPATWLYRLENRYPRF